MSRIRKITPMYTGMETNTQEKVVRQKNNGTNR